MSFSLSSVCILNFVFTFRPTQGHHQEANRRHRHAPTTIGQAAPTDIPFVCATAPKAKRLGTYVSVASTTNYTTLLTLFFILYFYVAKVQHCFSTPCSQHYIKSFPCPINNFTYSHIYLIFHHGNISNFISCSNNFMSVF